MKRKIKPVDLFIIIGFVNLILEMSYLYWTKGQGISVFSYGFDFGDFYFFANIVNDDNFIGNYPPLALLLFKFFFFNIDVIINNSYIDVQSIFLLILYFSVFIVCFVCVVFLFCKLEPARKVCVAFVLVFSYPIFWCGIGRGNMVIYAGVFLIAGYYMFNSNNRIVKEMGYLFIGIAASLKIYPAVIGLLLLSEKKYKEAIKLIIYGLVVFIIPFILLDISCMEFFEGTSSFANRNVYSHTSIIGNCVAVFDDQGQIIGMILSIAWIIWGLYYVFSEKKTWKSIAILVSFMTIILAESYVYTYIFCVLPLIEFFNQDERKIIDYFYAIMFSLLFTCFPILYIPSGSLIGVYISWITILVSISVEKIIKIVKELQKRKMCCPKISS